jgi:heparan-alpha-glucosaminide N-acetyltransferase
LSIAGAVQTPTPAASLTASRVLSIDIFRGLTIAVMIFVNELDGVRGLPWWTHHAHGNQDAMTYVDMVFPFFLFIVGMSMPLSITQRLKRNASIVRLWLHVIVRSLSLLVLGLILANAEKADAARMGMRGSVWALAALIGAGLYLNVYPKSETGRRYASILRAIGLVAVVAAFAIFRRTTDSGQTAWIDFSYPEILGLIALAYFSIALLYIPTRRWRWAAPVWLFLLLVLNVCCSARLVHFPRWLSTYEWPFGNGAHSALVMAGVVTAQIFFGPRPGTDECPPAKAATLTAALFALLALAAGWLTVPLGISKIRATPAWTLWNIGAAVISFTLLYWVCDQWRKTRWAALVHPAGANTLLTYLLPDAWYFVLGALNITWLETHMAFGWEGVVKTVVFTLVMLAMAWVLTRARVRLQL